MTKRIVSVLTLALVFFSICSEASAQLLGRRFQQRQTSNCAAEGADVAAFTDRDFFLKIPYEKMLEQLEGEAPTREMFQSQKLGLTLFQKRENHDSAFPRPADKDTVRAVFDVAGFSPEFGMMHYTNYVQANDKVAVIDVILKSPAGMVLRQHYRYVIAPFDDDTTFIRVSHYLAVHLKTTRFPRINRIIENITRKKMIESLQANTSQMAFCVQNIGCRYVAKPAESDDNESESEEDGDGDEKDDDRDQEEADNGDKAESKKEKQDSDKPKQDSEKQESEKQNSQNKSESGDSERADKQEGEVWVPELPESTLRKIEEGSPTPEAGSKKQPSLIGDANEGVIEIPKKEGPEKESLKISISGIRGGKGDVRVAVFKDAQEYSNFDARKPSDRQGTAFRTKVIAVKGKGPIKCEFDDLPDGKYVIAAFHDADRNERLNASMLGLPSEAYGFSRDARGRIGSPAFENALIEFKAENREFKINLK